MKLLKMNTVSGRDAVHRNVVEEDEGSRELRD